MRFNDAVRAGCKLLPNGVHGDFITYDGKSGCVMGAAIVGAVGVDKLNNHTHHERELFSELIVLARCPVKIEEEYKCSFYSGRSTRDVAVHLNNDHGWSREAIAEWVDPRPELHTPMPKEAVKEELVCA